MNAQGRGTAFKEEETAMLPAVAVGYLTQVFFQQHPPSVVRLRSSKELRTLAHCIDLICRNDPLRSLDVMIQRLKAIELSHIQGNWHQASQLELVMSEDQLATFRQEVKAAQQEVKADLALQQGAGQRRWSRPWRYEAPGTGDAPKTGDVKEGGGGDKLPDNAQREPRKGKGKGKKGGQERRVSMVSDLPPLRLEVLERAVHSEGIESGDREELLAAFQLPKMQELFKVVIESYVGEDVRKEAETEFASVLIDGLGRTEAEKFQAVQQHFKPLWLDEVPAMIPGCEPAEAPEPPHHHGDVDPQGAGVILDKYKNCEFHEWTGADGGVYVGKGAGALTCSIFQENYQDSLDPQLVGQALDGRRLYLLKDELQLGRDLVDRFGIERATVISGRPQPVRSF